MTKEKQEALREAALNHMYDALEAVAEVLAAYGDEKDLRELRQQALAALDAVRNVR